MDSKERKEKNKSTVIPLTSMKLSSKLFWIHECWENVKEIKEDQYLIKGYADHIPSNFLKAVFRKFYLVHS